MKLSVIYRPSGPASTSPYRVLDERRQEIAWANTFLDAQRIRQLSLRSLRAYAYDLLRFARWFQEPPRPLSEITESTLLDYVRRQLDREPQPTPQTVNHRLGVVHCLYRFHSGREIPAGQSHFQRAYTTPFVADAILPCEDPDAFRTTAGTAAGEEPAPVRNFAAGVPATSPRPGKRSCCDIGYPA